MRTTDVMNDVDADPVAALDQISEEGFAKGHPCWAASAGAAAKELRQLRAQAKRNRVTLGERAIALLSELEFERGHDGSCQECFGWSPARAEKQKAAGRWRNGHDFVGHWPSCSWGLVVGAAKATADLAPGAKPPEAVSAPWQEYWTISGGPRREWIGCFSQQDSARHRRDELARLLPEKEPIVVDGPFVLAESIASLQHALLVARSWCETYYRFERELHEAIGDEATPLSLLPALIRRWIPRPKR